MACSCRNGHTKIAQWLHSRGAKLHTTDVYPLRAAAIRGHLDIVKWILGTYEYSHIMKMQILMIAIVMQYTDIIDWLRDGGIYMRNAHAIMLRGKWTPE